MLFLMKKSIYVFIFLLIVGVLIFMKFFIFLHNNLWLENIEKKKIIVSDGNSDPLFEKYKQVVDNLDLSWCSLFKDKGQFFYRCRYTILSSLNKLNTIESCLEFSWTDFYNLCVDEVYYTNGECEKILDDVVRENCKNDFYYKKAISRKDKYWCLFIHDKHIKNLCFKVLEKQNNLKSNEEEINLFSSCRNKVLEKLSYQLSLKKKREICESVKSNQKLYTNCMNQYYYTKAIDRLDIESCKKIIDEELRQKCKQETLFAIAIEYTDISKCKSLEDEKKKKECEDKVNLRIISKNWLKDIKLCEKMHFDIYKKQCYEIILSNM